MKNSQVFPLPYNCVCFWQNGVGAGFQNWKDLHFGVLHTALKNHTNHLADNHPVPYFLIVSLLLKFK